ncbi:hypothetical protein BYT27DRAFT_7193985 [Phlegmacium glaucopus]|nr:hypothetical protein BYT27DRAFT_7193985 [Phlegmacium glaucopus]
MRVAVDWSRKECAASEARALGRVTLAISCALSESPWNRKRFPVGSTGDYWLFSRISNISRLRYTSLVSQVPQQPNHQSPHFKGNCRGKNKGCMQLPNAKVKKFAYKSVPNIQLV